MLRRYRLASQTARWSRFAVVTVEMVTAVRHDVVVSDAVTDPAVRSEAEHGAWRALRGLRKIDGTHHVTVTDVVVTAADTSVGDVHEATVYAIWKALDIIRPVPAYTGFTEPSLVTAWLRKRIGLPIAAVTEARHWHNGHRGPDADSLLHVWLHFTARPPTRLHGLGDELILHTEDPYPSYDIPEHGTTLVGPVCAPDLLASIVGTRLTDAAVILTNGETPTSAGVLQSEAAKPRSDDA